MMNVFEQRCTVGSMIRLSTQWYYSIQIGEIMILGGFAEPCLLLQLIIDEYLRRVSKVDTYLLGSLTR